MRTLVASPFEDDAAEILEWAYGVSAREKFVEYYFVENQRAGQAFMNVLRDVDNEEYRRLTGSIYDPFYKDDKIPNAIDRMTSK